jgi:uncharacterized protein
MSEAHHITSEGSATVQAAIEQVLTRHPSIVVAILFGSLAADHSRNDSDLDLAVASTTPLDSQIRIQLIEDLAVGMGRPVDLIDLAQTHGPLLQQILTNGRLLICTDRTRYADLLLRVVYEEADVMPYISPHSRGKKASMDRDLVEAKLESLRRCVERIAAKTPSSADQLAQNPDLQDIIALNLQRAVQLSVDFGLPSDLRD